MRNKIDTRRWVALILTIDLAILTGCAQSQPVEIIIPKEAPLVGKVYVGGAVSVPGEYPLKDGDTFEALVKAAGGFTYGADSLNLRLYVPESGARGEPQKIDINRAEAWLLEALPGIGETLAERIVAFREKNGPFRNILELTEVEGIGSATYDRIKGLITVSD